ncbi:MAG TPA: hypothetical protein VFQ45_10690 [Longimicrobium sp.]|nr:hypothetical protein [Longimicrobium sp.]
MPETRYAEAPLRPVGAVDEVQVVGALAEIVVERLQLCTTARSVWLHPNTAHHIATQRGMDQGEADFIFSHLPNTILRPHFCGCDPRAPRRYDLIHVPAGSGRAVFAAIKVVAAAEAASRTDEIWVSTAHPLPRSFLSRKRYRESLHRLDGA